MARHQADTLQFIFRNLQLPPSFARIERRVDRAIRVSDAERIGVTRVIGKAAGHMHMSGWQTVLQESPIVAAVVAAENLRLGAADGFRSVATETDRIEWPRAHRAISLP